MMLPVSINCDNNYILQNLHNMHHFASSPVVPEAAVVGTAAVGVFDVSYHLAPNYHHLE